MESINFLAKGNPLLSPPKAGLGEMGHRVGVGGKMGCINMLGWRRRDEWGRGWDVGLVPGRPGS